MNPEIIVRFTCHICKGTLEQPLLTGYPLPKHATDRGWGHNDGEYTCDTCIAPRRLCPACKQVRFRFGVAVPGMDARVCSTSCIGVYVETNSERYHERAAAKEIDSEINAIIAGMKGALHV